MEEPNRYHQWIGLSIKAGKYETYLMPYVQGLGRLDLRLISEGIELLSKINNNSSPEEAFKLTDQFTLSHLWVLGAYEVIRTLCDFAKNNQERYGKKEYEKIKEAKHFFERLRVPLAKLEPNWRHKDTDFRVAYPVLNLDDGIAWAVNEKTIITRMQLSNLFLDIFNT